MRKNSPLCLNSILKMSLLFIGTFSFYLIIFYVIFIAKGYYHADCTDTIMWAQASYDAGALMNPDFAYAGLMPFGGNLIMFPFVALFGVGMKAQIMGMALFCVLFTAAVIFLCRAMDFQNHWIAVMVSVVLILVSASDKLREIFWGHIIYYSLGILFLMVGLALVLKCIQAEKETSWQQMLRKHTGLFVVLFVWTALYSMNGVQSLTICGIPIVAAVVAERFFDVKASLTDRKNVGRYIITVVLVMGMAVGLMLGKLANGDIVAGYAEAYSGFSESSKWVNNLLDFFPKFFTLLGVKIHDNMLLYSVEGICNLLRIICALVLLIVPVVMAFLYPKFKEVSYRLMILIHHFMSLLILMGWVFGKLSAANWRLSPIVVTSALLCMMFVRWIISGTDYHRFAAMIVIPVGCMFLIITNDIFHTSQTVENANLTRLAEYLEQKNLEYGYATFWQANIITMISDSDVKVRGINIDNNGYSKRFYQTNENWYEKAQGYDKYFVILTEKEYTDYYPGNSNIEEPEEMLECGGYKIMVYGHNVFE